MKKALLTWNVRFYAIMYSVSLFFAGTQMQKASNYVIHEIYRGSAILLIPPIMFWIFLKIGIYLRREKRYAKDYCLMGVATLLFGGPFWPYVAYMNTWLLYKDSNALLTYTKIATVFSVLIAAFYFVCAGIVRKEQKAERETA